MKLPKELSKVKGYVSSLINIVKHHGVELNNETAYYISRAFKEKVIPCSRNVRYVLPMNGKKGEIIIATVTHFKDCISVGFRDVYGKDVGSTTIDSAGELRDYRL